MTIFTRFNRPKAVVPPIGDGTVPIYEEVLDEHGHMSLQITGQDNLFDYVQSSKEETLVYNIISRYQRGDLTALNKRVGQYIDVVGMPTNLAEAHQRLIDVENKFNSLPVDIKKKFDNSFNVYVQTVSNASPDQLMQIFGVTKEQVAVVKDGDTNVEK